MAKLNTPKGTRDFLPEQTARRSYIFDTVKSVFNHYGFSPIETPAMELKETLMGKYGEEGDRLIFKILESGEKLTKGIDSIYDRMYIRGVFENGLYEYFRELEKSINYRGIRGVIQHHILPHKSTINDAILEYLVDNESNLFDDFKKCYLEFQMHSETKSFRNEVVYPISEGWLREFFLKLSMNRLIVDSKSIEDPISEKALRYDLTVPFARFVVQHQNDLSFPFKRYQIQPVWRADRPQKGRYREFFQCDVDMIGSNSLLNEVELIQVVSEVFGKLKLPEAVIKINNRKILEGIAEVIGEPEKLIDITVALDKLDKIGREKVENELLEKGLSPEAIGQLGVLFENASLESVSDFLKSSEIGQKGVEELSFLLGYAKELGIEQCEFDPTLARGLNYYTGAIFEVVHPDFPSSICGGGRYDDLTGIFGLKDMSGVGVSFGADRIYDLLLDKELFPEQVVQSTKIMFVNFGSAEAKQCILWAKQLRDYKINTEVYPDSAKMKKQMKYANDKNIPFVALVGDREIESGLLTIKDMNSGDQLQLSIDDLVQKLN